MAGVTKPFLPHVRQARWWSFYTEMEPQAPKCGVFDNIPSIYAKVVPYLNGCYLFANALCVREPMNKDPAWFVAMSKPRAEEFACQQLVNQGFDVYLPMCPRLVRRQGRYVTEVSTMFPRYLFVRPFHEEQSISSIRSTVGVQQLVRFGAEFAQAAAPLVADIKAMEAFLRDNPESLPFKAGDEVEITEGPFAGITAKVFACAESRVLLLFQLMGSMRKLGFSPDQCRRV